MNADGSDQRNLTRNPFSDTDPAWSPNGTQIAFASTRDRNYEVYVMDADGSNIRRLTNHPGIDVHPTWSPDGSRIAFLTRRHGNVEVYWINVDGSDLDRITFNSYDDFEIDWSPDGRLIALASQAGEFANIHTINVEAAPEEVAPKEQLTDTEAHDAFPKWSPDGSQIAFVSNRDGDENWEVYIMNSDGSDQRRLTYSAGLDGISTWSPNGTHLAFESNRDGDNEIYLMNVKDAIRNPEGAGIIRLTDNDANDQQPAWRPESEPHAGLIVPAPAVDPPGKAVLDDIGTRSVPSSTPPIVAGFLCWQFALPGVSGVLLMSAFFSPGAESKMNTYPSSKSTTKTCLDSKDCFSPQ